MAKTAPTSPNYTPTNDPNVVIGKHGATITRQDFETANKHGFAWKDFPAYADYVGGWATPVTAQANVAPPPAYYRHYGTSSNIPSADVEVLKARYASDPKITAILTSNIAPKGQVPQYSPENGDIVRKLIDQEHLTAQNSNYPNAGLYDAMAAAKK